MKPRHPLHPYLMLGPTALFLGAFFLYPLALALMVIHLAWAVVVLIRNRDTEKQRFHRFSLMVWAIWLIPYITGAIGANLR